MRLSGWARRALLAVVISAGPVPAETLPGTQPLTAQGDFATLMQQGMDRFLAREVAASVERRQRFWNRDFSSAAAYETSVAGNRARFRKIIGVVDERVPFASPELDATIARPAQVASAPRYKVYAVRWPVLPGVNAEGLLLDPVQEPVARVVALGDADWTPEMLAGLAPGVTPAAQFARRLAENGCQVLVPVLLNRRPTAAVDPRISRPTNQTHREFIYRMAFELGRHVIGYEVQKVLAAVDWFSREPRQHPIGVFGYGEGGLVALYAAAADRRIGAAAVSGYFQSRQELWKEPVYRNVWGLLAEFGDAEIATLVAPRAIVVEASRGPELEGPPPVTKEYRVAAAPGRLASPPLESTRTECERARPVFAQLGAGGKLSLVGSGGGDPGSPEAIGAFLRDLRGAAQLRSPGPPPKDSRTGFDPAAREWRQFAELVEFNQNLVRRSPFARRDFWAKADPSSVDNWVHTKEWYRRYLWDEVIGRLPDPSEPLSAQTRTIYDRPGWTGYEVLLPVWPEVFAYGVLLVPRNLKPGERRPVVVCQHGRAGRPRDVIDPDDPRTQTVYKRFAAQLADRGFIVYAPQNPYIFEEAYRYLQRKANPLKASLFSFILGQHQRTLDWLAGLPFVDPARMGFYGLSYGGKTAVRVPPLLDRYALSICSGDFGEYAGKMAGTDRGETFMYTIEHEMYEFDLANTFNYGDLATLMAPRPFMVERGHKDGVGVDEWVAYEYAKVRRFYAFLGLPDRTAIEFFNGVHEINAQGTFRFLHRQLNWPEPQ